MILENNVVAVKIKSYRVRQAGTRGLILALPGVWSDDLGLKPGFLIDVYRDQFNRLTLVPPGAPAPGTLPAPVATLGDLRGQGGSVPEDLKSHPGRVQA